MSYTDYFYILKGNQENYDYIVISVNGDNLIENIDEVTEIITTISSHKRINVILDNLLFANNYSDRFISAKIVNKQLIVESLQYVDIPKTSKIREESAKFFRQHPNIVNDSGILTSEQKNRLLTGIVI